MTAAVTLMAMAKDAAGSSTAPENDCGRIKDADAG
jgi:hypothetical protein